MSKGITLIEIILVVSIVSVIGLSMSPFITTFLNRNNLESSTDILVSSLTKAQFYSMNGRLGEVWGICLDGTTVRIVAGDCETPTFETEASLASGISVQGTQSVLFNSRGEPSNEVNITLENSSDLVTVLINLAGGFDVN